MQGKTHMTVGVVTMACCAVLYPEGITIHNQDVLFTIAGVTAAVGSYLPDIDIEQSKLGQKYHFISKHLKHRGFTHTLVIPIILLLLLISVVALPLQALKYLNYLILALCILGIIKIVIPIAKYGKADIYDIVHALCMGYAAITLVNDVTTTIVLASALFGLWFGWIMHMVADLCNGKGIPLLPGMNHVHIMSVTTGTWQEAVWLVCYLVIVIGLTYWKGYVL